MHKHVEMIVKEGLFIALFQKKGLGALEKDDIYNISYAPSEKLKLLFFLKYIYI